MLYLWLYSTISLMKISVSYHLKLLKTRSKKLRTKTTFQYIHIPDSLYLYLMSLCGCCVSSLIQRDVFKKGRATAVR